MALPKQEDILEYNPDDPTFGLPKQKGILSPDPSVAPEPPISPADPDWGKGDLKIEDSGVFYTPPGEDATVEGRLSGLLERGSPYIEAAKAGAQRQSNQRGLLNSTMAATAGEKAGIESALPIAQQDAGYFQQRGLQAQQGEIQKGLYETQGDISERLANAGYEHEATMKAIDIEWNKLDLQSRMDVEFERMSDARKTEFNALVNKISEDYMNDHIEILINPNFGSDASRAIAINLLNENTRRRYEMAATVSEVELTWPGVPENADIDVGEVTRSTRTAAQKAKDKKRQDAIDEEAINKRYREGSR